MSPLARQEETAARTHEEHNQNNKKFALTWSHVEFPPSPDHFATHRVRPRQYACVGVPLLRQPTAYRLPALGMIANRFHRGRNGNCQDQSDRAPEPAPE